MKKYRNEDTLVFIDGGYLSHITFHYGQNNKHLKFKIESLGINLAKEKGLWCKEIYYYTAPPYQSSNPSEEEKKRKAGYDSFINKLKSSLIVPIYIKEGRCIKLEKGPPFQKGVDVLITIDLLRTAQRREVKKVILITADTDFVPLLKVIREEYGLKVILAHLSYQGKEKRSFTSNYLLENSDDNIKIEKRHLIISI